MAARLVGNPDQQFFKNDGSINAGGTLTFYTAGTTTPKTIYSTSDTGGATHTNPHTLDSAGRPTTPIFTDGMYDVLIKDSAGSTLVSVSDYVDNNSAIATDLSNLVQNQSFETDTDSDGTPDNWTLTPHANITVAQSASAPGHGAKCLLFTVTGAGSATALSSLFEVSNLDRILGDFLINTSAAALSVTGSLALYDSAQSLLSTQTIYLSTTNPTSWTIENFAGITVGDHETTARYAALKFTIADGGTTGTVCLDGISLYSEPFSASPNFPSGLQLSIDTDTSHDINLTAGSTKNSGLTVDMVLSTEMTKQIDAAWAVGDDAGGLFSGSTATASSWLGVYLIKNTTSGSVDWGFDDSASLTPTAPSGYNAYRYLGAVKLDSSSNIVAARWYGSRMVVTADPVTEFTDATITDSAVETVVVAAPPFSLIHYSARCVITAGQAQEMFIMVRPGDTSWTVGNVKMGISTSATDTIDEMVNLSDIQLDSTSSIDYAVDLDSENGTETLTFFILGWDDLKRNTP